MGNQTLGDLAVSALKGVVAFELFFLVMVAVFRGPSERTTTVALAVGVVALLLALIALVESTIDGADGVAKGPDRWVQKLGYALALAGTQIGLLVGTVFNRAGSGFGAGVALATGIAVAIALISAYRTWPRSPGPGPHEGL